MKNAYRPHRTALLAVAATLALLPALAPAQAIYRIVGHATTASWNSFGGAYSWLSM